MHKITAVLLTPRFCSLPGPGRSRSSSVSLKGSFCLKRETGSTLSPIPPSQMYRDSSGEQAGEGSGDRVLEFRPFPGPAPSWATCLPKPRTQTPDLAFKRLLS